MNNPLVSIMIITYNQIEFVHETLTSALEQDYPNLEVVVADDNSKDGTAEVILEYAEKYPGRLIPVLGKVQLGITGNSNRGLKVCQGKYIAIQGGDDVLLPGKILMQVQWLEADESRVLCGHDLDVFDSDTGRHLCLWSQRFKYITGGKGARDFVRYGCLYGATSVMIRTAALPVIGFDERIPIASDWKLWIDCLAEDSRQFGAVDGVYARYRQHNNNITKSRNEARTDDLFVTLALVESRYAHLLADCRYSRSKIFRGMGKTALLNKNRYLAWNYFYNSLVTYPLTWKIFAWLLLSIAPYPLIESVINRNRKF